MFKRREVERSCRGRQSEADNEIAGGQTRWPRRHEQTHQVEACIDGKGGEGNSSLR